jgi:uncharacterized repeat protein (TIGR01451 family)
MRSRTNLIIIVALLFIAVYIPPPSQAALIKQSVLATPNCWLYPLTTKQTIIDSATLGVSKIDILEGNGLTDRGWLAWDPTWNNSSDLMAELQNPQLSLSDYTHPLNSNDHTLEVGDYVKSLAGNNSSVQTQVETLVGQELIIPVWDNFTNSPIAAYHISSFARVRIDSSSDINLVNLNPEILAIYLGQATREQCSSLALTKSGPGTAKVGNPITYTLTLTNNSSFTTTNLVITDAIPANASYLSGGTLVGNVVSWTVPTLPVSSTLTRTFSVTASQTITNSDYRVSADGNFSAAGAISVVTIVTEDDTKRIYLPVILKNF